ncbi:MAG: hypothetical protein MUF68_07465 [Cyclobacteriaceae bacterium]|jgi:predicted component of viral defense system (DUF524 family)|nr:hypothetical protein [Cyclobacteriaceae bacterium]
MKQFVIFFIVMLALTACKNNTPPLVANIQPNPDSLWKAQVTYLSSVRATLKKEVEMNNKTEAATISPKDSLAWSKELEVLLAIKNIQQPSNAIQYTSVKSKDTSSNLMVTTYRTDEKLKLKELRIFSTPSGVLKKIEGDFKEINSLLSSERTIALYFSDVYNKTVLTSYSVNGYQQLVLSDTVYFNLKANISIP